MPGTSPDGVARGGSLGSLVHEIKYVMPASCAGPAEAWLGAVCRPERQRPPAWVRTVYFDTPELERLDEKVNSDYLKSKVRVRWYESLSGAAHETAYLEVKRRVGTSRDKERAPLDVPARALSRWTLEDPRWLPLLAAGGVRVGRMRAVLQLRYLRSRFLHDPTGSRVALDRQIEAVAVHAAMRRLPVPVRVGLAVVEWKSHAQDLPFQLQPLTSFGARRRSFSKYQAAAEAAGLD